uniref:Exostosin GT47 domain-containing protein n=1 Tax=Fagus sylvatica TaxID=28930 RepID=A0A2N9GBM4_FAGSY
MDIAVLAQRLCHIAIWRLLLIIGMVFAVLVVSQCFALLYGKTFSLYPPMVVRNATLLISSQSNKSFVANLVVGNDTYASDSDSDSAKETGYENETKETYKHNDPASDDNTNSHKEFKFEKDDPNGSTNLTLSEVQNQAGILPVVSQGISTKGMGNFHADSRTSDSFFIDKLSVSSSVGNVKQTMGLQPKDKKMKPMQAVSVTLNNNSTMTSISNSILKRWEKQLTSISQINSILLNSHVSSHSVRPRWSSVRDRELLSAKLGIENAPVIRNTPGLYASLFRNVSMFKSSQLLRTELSGKNIHGQKDLEKHLKNYVDLIAGKYRFWNRTGGADHFLVACHDWASKLTRWHMRNCIRSLCNANVAKGFKIGKDTTLPVTYIRSVEDPLKDLGGRPPSQRYILAFFAGGMHGYVRPILLQYWENREPDMKIFGPLPRDIEGKKIYREYMKSSKYCICARGYEVHTPRVVEAIFYECVPVIISDNYVPPFFEVLNWEAFSVFIQEKDIPNLRNILLSIPKEKYLAMQLRVKMVQKHFLWHKKPVQYDLFHMVLHSVWYNRVFQINPR